jgi:D-sedoheptulose 7-phosphate isomerase
MNAKMKITSVENLIRDYLVKLQTVLAESNWEPVELLSQDVLECWKEKRQIFLCGNGGSAGNAIHLANDFIYGVAKKTGRGLRVNALTANPAIITCLANDVGYDSIFSEQLAVLANSGDLLIVLSGSGNSKNIIQVIEQAKKIGVKSYGILGFSGGLCKEMVDVPIHFNIDDMQIAEDLQLVVGHMIMKWIHLNLTEKLS